MSKIQLKQKLMVFCAICTCTLSLPAVAQLAPDSDAPVDITADELEIFQEENYSIWTGNVQIVQGQSILTAPKVTTFGVLEGSVERIEAEGGVRYTTATEAISGAKAVYYAEKDTVAFTGSVVVVQGEQILSGEKLIYHINTGEITFTAAEGSRVRGIFVNTDSKSGS